MSPLVFFFFVNFSPALYYLNAWNRLGGQWLSHFKALRIRLVEGGIQTRFHFSKCGYYPVENSIGFLIPIYPVDSAIERLNDYQLSINGANSLARVFRAFNLIPKLQE